MFWLLYSTYCNLILVLCSITTCIYYVFPRLQEQQRAAPCVTISSLRQSELRMRSECGRSFAVVSVENSWQRLTWWTGSRPSGNGCFHNVWRIILTELEVSGNPGAAKGKPCVLSWFSLSSFGWAAGDIQKRWKVASEVNVSEPKQTLRGEAAEPSRADQLQSMRRAASLLRLSRGSQSRQEPFSPGPCSTLTSSFSAKYIHTLKCAAARKNY